MQKKMGIWIDHRKAIIITLDASGETQSIREIESDLERHVRLSGGSRTKRTPWGPQQVASNGKMEARQQQQLRRFYDKVIEAVSDAYKIMLMGPGEAKVELKKAMGKNEAIAESLVHMETCERMTLPQTAARVRDFFSSVP